MNKIIWKCSHLLKMKITLNQYHLSGLRYGCMLGLLSVKGYELTLNLTLKTYFFYQVSFDGNKLSEEVSEVLYLSGVFINSDKRVARILF